LIASGIAAGVAGRLEPRLGGRMLRLDRADARRDRAAPPEAEPPEMGSPLNVR